MMHIRTIIDASAPINLDMVQSLPDGAVFRTDQETLGDGLHEFIKTDDTSKDDYYIVAIHLKTGQVVHFPKTYPVQPAKVVAMVATYA